MYLTYRTATGEEMPLVDNEYFTLTDIDGFTQADVGISSVTMSDMDGDIVNSQTVTPRTVTITLRVNSGVNPEECKRYVTAFVKPKQTGILALNYRDRDTTLTGVVQSFSMPRFENGVAMQFSLYCSQPLWEDVNALYAYISDIISLHHWAIIPKETPDIVMGEIMEQRGQYITNNGDVAVGMEITIVANGGAISNPRIMRENSYDFFGVDVSMSERDELVISTVRGKKTVTLNGENIINQVTQGSTWLQLEVGINRLIITDDYEGLNMQFTLKARELYV